MNDRLNISAFKCITAIIVSLASPLLPGSVFALGLADIETHSTLNQPLHATIPVSATQAELDLLKVGLAPNKAFLRTGIERKKILRALIFELVKKGHSPHIKISSKKLIREPMLEFILSIESGNGRMLRSYSIFLSPQ